MKDERIKRNVGTGHDEILPPEAGSGSKVMQMIIAEFDPMQDHDFRFKRNIYGVQRIAGMARSGEYIGTERLLMNPAFTIFCLFERVRNKIRQRRNA